VGRAHLRQLNLKSRRGRVGAPGGQESRTHREDLLCCWSVRKVGGWGTSATEIVCPSFPSLALKVYVFLLGGGGWLVLFAVPCASSGESRETREERDTEEYSFRLDWVGGWAREELGGGGHVNRPVACSGWLDRVVEERNCIVARPTGDLAGAFKIPILLTRNRGSGIWGKVALQHANR